MKIQRVDGILDAVIVTVEVLNSENDADEASFMGVEISVKMRRDRRGHKEAVKEAIRLLRYWQDLYGFSVCNVIVTLPTPIGE